jgi:hypothetical protein
MTNVTLHSSPLSRVAANLILRCVVCRRAFDFNAGETAVILRHIAYGYDFVHEGACLATAEEWIFAEPGYDRPAFSRDAERVRLLQTAAANGWAAVAPNPPAQILAWEPVSFEPLHGWVLVEHADGSQRIEGLVKDAELQDDPGAVEFPEARIGLYASLGYASEADRQSPNCRAHWAALIAERYQAARAALAAQPLLRAA